jgi:Fic family protein
MSYLVLTEKERDELVDLFFRLRSLGEQHPLARKEAMTALRYLKAVHSNAIEDKSVDRIFLQVLLHNAGVEGKEEISKHYNHAGLELRGQEECLQWLEAEAENREPFSITMFQKMHRMMFEKSIPAMAGKFREGEVRISGMKHRPPHHRQISEALFQHLDDINSSLLENKVDSRESMLRVLEDSARIHYLLAHVHPYEDGNGRVARAAGDYAMLMHGFYYDVIMTDYRNVYLDALESSCWADTKPLFYFLEFSYLETLRRISGFFNLIGK